MLVLGCRCWKSESSGEAMLLRREWERVQAQGQEQLPRCRRGRQFALSRRRWVLVTGERSMSVV